jgi:hypothetical protein
MIRRILLAFSAALVLCSSALNADASIVYLTSFRNFGTGSAPPSVQYGATGDTGDTRDPTVDSSVYSSGATYHYGDLVSSGGVYYWSLVLDTYEGVGQNTGHALTDTNSWRQISEFAYVDFTSGTDPGTVSSDPATAKAAPFKTLQEIAKRITNGNGGTVLKPSAMVLLKRGDTQYGNINANQVRSSLSISSMVNDGTTTTVTTALTHYLTTGGTVTTSGATPSTCNSGANAVITVTGPTTFTFANTCNSTITGTLTYLEFHGNYIVTAWGSHGSPRPIIKYADNSITSNQDSALYGSRAGFIVRDIDAYGEDTRTLKFSGLTGSCAVGDTVTGETSGRTATVYRDPGVAGRLEIVNASGGFTTSEVLNCTSGGSATYASLSTTGPGGIHLAAPQSCIVNSEVHGWSFSGILIGISGAYTSGNNNCVVNSIIHNNLNTNGSNGGGFAEGDGSGLWIVRNTVYDNGTPSSTTNHNMYIAWVSNTTIRGNYVYMTGNYGNHGLIMHGNLDTVLIADNDFQNNNNGIGVNSGYSATEAMYRFTVERNRIRGTGNLTAQTGGYGMLLSTIQSSVIRNNWIADAKLGSIKIYLQTGSTGTGDTVMQDVGIYHNTFIQSGASSLFVFQIQGALGTGLDIRNNIFQTTNNTSLTYTLSNDAATPAANLQFNSNVYYAPNITHPVKWGGVDIGNTIGAIRTAMAGTVGAESAGTLANPLFTNAGTYDLTLQGGSPAKSIGAALGITTDFAGNSRSGSTPSAGAYE